MIKNKRILVTGGAGFLGSNISDLLIKNNEVVCLDNLSTGSKKNISALLNNKNFTFIHGSILDKKTLDIAMKDIDIVFHYAAVVGVKRTLENPMDVLKVNIDGTKNVLECALKNNAKKVVNISSSEVYGEPDKIPEKEDGRLNAKLPYAVSKHVGELYSQGYFSVYGLKTTSLRLFNVYGQRQTASDYGFVVGIFIKQAIENKPITVFGDGKQTRDFMYVLDNLKATIMACESSHTDGKILNIGTGVQTSIHKLAKTVKKATGAKSEIKFLPKRRYDIVHRCADTTYMKMVLKFTPGYTINQGIKQTAEWYKPNARNN